jgi:hypothetical protein
MYTHREKRVVYSGKNAGFMRVAGTLEWYAQFRSESIKMAAHYRDKKRIAEGKKPYPGTYRLLGVNDNGKAR